MSIANTILEQLGGNKFIVMTGAKCFVNTGKGLQFSIGAGAVNKANKVLITLGDDDLYTVKFFTIRGVNIVDKGEFPGVYADRLQALFTEQTGFDVTL